MALGFQYDNLVMEEAAQIMEIETFIPMVLQNPDPATGRSRLKRVVLIGDHHQLPPVVKNQAFQKYSRLDQSLFARFVRLGVPAIMLDLQALYLPPPPPPLPPSPPPLPPLLTTAAAAYHCGRCCCYYY